MIRGSFGWALALVALACGGCGHELVRVSIEPPPREHASSPARRSVLAPVQCVSGQGLPPEGLVELLRASAAFQGPLLLPDAPGADDALLVARLEVTRTATPVIVTDFRYWTAAYTVMFPPFLIIPLVWTEREPDLFEELTLELGVRGELPARYTVSARGTIVAQSPNVLAKMFGGDQTPIVSIHLATLRAEAFRSLASQVAWDEPGLRRLAEQLAEDEAPPTSLAPLLVTTELSVPRARWRTKRLLELRAGYLSTLLAEATTAELRGHAVGVEACLLDLTNAAELARDTAERALAEGKADEAEEPRALSLAYRERVEVLKAILEAFRAEVDARGR